jgi:predicted GNAT family N-acyltransferase
MTTAGAMFSVRAADWARDERALRSLRREVFVVEQGLPESLERDERDGQSRHALAQDAHAEAVGCARLLPDGRIGRIAVRREWRGRGVGTALVEQLVALAREDGHRRVRLDARSDACGFYARRGFVAIGAPFVEAGVAHQPMQRDIEVSSNGPQRVANR